MKIFSYFFFYVVLKEEDYRKFKFLRTSIYTKKKCVTIQEAIIKQYKIYSSVLAA